MATILQSPFFVELILPFLLVFAVVFALLQKSKVLGDGKTQVDAIVAFVVGLVVVAFANAVNLILGLTMFLGVAIVVLLVFMLLYGSVASQEGFKIDDRLKSGLGWVFSIAILIGVVVVVLILTGAWDWLAEQIFYGAADDSLVNNAVMIIIVVVAIAAVVMGGKAGGGGKDKDD